MNEDRPVTGMGRWMIVMGAAVIGGCAVGDRRPALVNASVSPWEDGGLTGRRLATDHFEIISTLQDATLEAALPGFLEAAHRCYELTLPADGTHDRLVTHIFGSRDQWTRFAAVRYPMRFDIYRRIRTGGFTEGSTAVSFHTGRASTLATLAHEGWHQYANARCPRPIPAWLNEGLACYHEAFDFTGPEPRFTPNRNTFRRNSLRDAMRENRMFSLRELLATDAGQMIGRHPGEAAQAYYAQAWALIILLRHGPDKRLNAAFERLLADISAGTFSARVGAARLTEPALATDEPGVAAFRTYFEVTPEAMDDAFRRHLTQLAGFPPRLSMASD